MSLNLEQKKSLVAEVQSHLAAAQAVVFAEYRGMTVAELTRLRRQGRASGLVIQVVKNTLMRRAVEGTPFAVVQEHLKGPLIYSSGTDPVALAKVFSDVAKTNDKLVITVGALGGKLIDAAALGQLAKMPSREQLLAQLMGTMQAPVSTFVRTLNEVPARFARTLAAVRDQKAA
ncbi:MAG: 50S ribosomal protein L10 [Pseudomonadota bacterium]|uniref:50S ribosomal protein L10 n=1 Tax=Thermithiobacillus tepidarius TaxID=929 RepID=UPI00042223BD|nr:50S ribosomal protein L10 [Thermithiobacillus tepidarius]